MSVETAHSHFPPLPPGTMPLWVAVIGVPAAWAAQMQAVYVLAPWACAGGHRAVLVLISVLGLLAAGAGCVLCMRYVSRDAAGATGPDFGPRTRFLAQMGTLLSATFATLIVAQMIAAVMLDPCAT